MSWRRRSSACSAAAAEYSARTSPRPAASSATRGSLTAATTTVCRAVSAGSAGNRPSSITAGASSVNSTTRDRRLAVRMTVETIARWSASVSTGSTSASAALILTSRFGPPAEGSVTRATASWAIRLTRSPARAATAASSRAASIAWSRRGASPIRPALVRPVSRTQMTRRSRSGRNDLTATVPRRALARQSIIRTSSPGT